MAELYSEEQIDKLSKYEKVLDKWVDMIDDAATVDVKKNSDFRKVRILLETINTSTESIHKAAANKAKADANKNNEESNKLLVAIALKELASDRNIQHDDSSRDAMFEAIKPIDNVVKDEDSIGIGSLSLTDLERPKDE
jgi:hypothetical protein